MFWLIIGLAFLWLMVETRCLTIRLMVGDALNVFDWRLLPPAPMISRPAEPVLLLAQVNPVPKNWQVRTYGDKALLLCRNCDSKCRLLKEEQFYGWKIPAKTIKLYGSTLRFERMCNLQRARMLKDVVKANTHKLALPTYQPVKDAGRFYLNFGGWQAKPLPKDYEPTIKLEVDGKSISLNGDYKPGKIKDWMGQFTTRARIGKKMVNLDVGIADRA